MSPQSVNRLVLEWYRNNARDLPWRGFPYQGNPYAVLVSEIMLQQTQVARVIPKFIQFMTTFPTVRSLAAGTPSEVIALWSGMGYNNRAVRLHRLAGIIVSDHNGKIPEDVATLVTLPGIGPYSASAIACFAYDAAVPVLDTNIYRVLSRLIHGVTPPSRSEIKPIAKHFLPNNNASAWHQALMDIGATICTVTAPRCMLCPLQQSCSAAPALQDGNDRSLEKASVPYAPKQGQFKGSTRYYRGRIVEELRRASSGGLPISQMGMLFMETPIGGFPAIIDALLRDGLAVKTGEVLHLPQANQSRPSAPGKNSQARIAAPKDRH